jgi:RNase adapter protein RapZ
MTLGPGAAPAAQLVATQEAASPRRVVLVTGLSGGGRASILHVLEDLGYEAVDNPPLPLMEELVTRGDRPAAIGVDTRSRGFDPAAILHTVARLRLNPALRPELVFAWARESVLLRRYTETRRRHPLAPRGRVIDGITAEIALMMPVRDAADMVIDTSDLPISALRATIEARFGGNVGATEGMTISLTSFAYPRGLPPDADLVFDVRFLRNPHYDPMLRPRTGLDPEVAAFVEADPAFQPLLDKLTDLLSLLLPRFVGEGKKYAGIAVGCTGGRHRSVHVVQCLAARLAELGPLALPPDQGAWRVTINHRELALDAGQSDPAQNAHLIETAQNALRLRGETGAASSTVDTANLTGRSGPEQAQEA